MRLRACSITSRRDGEGGGRRMAPGQQAESLEPVHSVVGEPQKMEVRLVGREMQTSSGRS
jgi:hypothetical protein